MAKSRTTSDHGRREERRRLRNVHYKTLMRTSIKKVLAATDKSEAEKLFRFATALVDRLARKHIIHRNKAANVKSRLARRVSGLAEKAAK